MVSIGANASGDPRWDLIYALVVVDANGTSLSRKVKDPVTKAIAGSSLVTTLVTTVALGVTAGTAAASPVWPTIPADSGSSYYIPLAYVRVPDGFGAGSTVLATDFAVVAPCLALASAVGGSSLAPATGAIQLPTAMQQSWGAAGGARPGRFMPSTLVGGQSLLIYLDLYDAVVGNRSHATGDVIDSRDWRGRVARWTAVIDDTPAAAGEFWIDATFGTYVRFPGDEFNDVNPGVGFDVAYRDIVQGIGHSLGAGAGGKHTVLGLDSDRAAIPGGTALQVWVDPADGQLRLSYNAPITRRFFIWLDFSGPFENSV